MRWFSTMTGLFAAGTALVVLLVINTASITPATHTQTPVVPTAVFTPSIIESTPLGIPGELPGVPNEVAAAIGASGYSTFVHSQDVDQLLTAEVVQTLMNHGAILVVPESGTTPRNP